jgi:hypothetical protein
MLHTLSFKGNPPLVPALDVPCFRATIKEGLAEQLVQVVRSERQHILDTTPPPPIGGNFLSGRFQHYNLLQYEHPALRELEAFLKDSYVDYMNSVGQTVEPAYIRMWANSYPQGSGLVWHNHFESLFGIEGPVWGHVSGNTCIRTFGTKTWYLSPFCAGSAPDDFANGYEHPADAIGIDNVDGETVFFPSWLIHRTDKNANPEQNRMTLAFDIIPEATYLRKKANHLFRRLL